jgi:hypothetical protein
VRAYVATTGAMFGLIILAHILRLVNEGAQLLAKPPFIFTSLAAIGLLVWAIALLSRNLR